MDGRAGWNCLLRGGLRCFLVLEIGGRRDDCAEDQQPCQTLRAGAACRREFSFQSLCHVRVRWLCLPDVFVFAIPRKVCVPALVQRLIKALQVDAPACLVSVESTQGSVPREAGAWMAVLPGFGGALGPVVGTIGGGHLELEAIQIARNLLVLPEAADGLPDEEGMVRRWALGPSLGQCCGGVVHLRFELVRAEHAQALQKRLMPSLHPLALFGGGHVGAAIVNALAPLPFAVRWIDSRDGIFPADVPPQVQVEHSEPVQRAVADLPSGSRVLVMSFSHAEDLDIVAACLERCRRQDDLPFIGLIGSRTKWAAFQHRLEARGFGPAELDRVSCPIGLPGIRGKEPAVIAASVVAQLLLDVSSAR